MAQASPNYSYTERKRIRKSFGKRESVLTVPYLLTMQSESYVGFLQKDVPPAQRKPEGLQAAFQSDEMPSNSRWQGQREADPVLGASPFVDVSGV